MPAIALRREAGRIRDLAVALVDANAGYTVEQAQAPHAHAAEYDAMERRLTKLLPSLRLKLSKF